jgi:signal transduction histidine kinase
MIGRQLDRLLPPDRQSEVSDLLKKIKAGDRVENYETVRLTKDGRAINVSLTVSPITDLNGRVVAASTIGRDITKTKAAEEESHRLLVETERANAELHKMDRVKDEFLSIMTHDLKSPLVAVLGYSDMMLGGMGGQLNEKHRAFVDTIKRQGQHLQSMIDGLLDYTRTEFGKLVLKREDFNLNNLVLEAIKAFTPEAEQRKITLDFSLPAEQITVSADQRMIDEVVTNLLSNSLKYSSEGGRVTVTLSRGEKEALFRISDTGKGIAPDNIGRVFDKFFMIEENAAREKRSLGLGLYIAKKFIEAHKGHLSAESPGEGKGTTFSFTLPL